MQVSNLLLPADPETQEMGAASTGNEEAVHSFLQAQVWRCWSCHSTSRGPTPPHPHCSLPALLLPNLYFEEWLVFTKQR